MRVILSLVNVLLFLLVASSCKEEQTHVMKIDLSQLKTDIRYSEFVDSVSYLTLHTNDSCIVSEVGRLYIDGDYTILVGRGGNGVCVYLINHLHCNIAKYGRGPGEYIGITDICLDKLNKHICIYDEMGKILRYTYDGQLVKEQPFKDLMRSFTNIAGKFVCIQPADLRGRRSGVWCADFDGVFEKELIPGCKDNVLECIHSKYFHYYSDGEISYYDYYENCIYSITPDTAVLKYQIDLAQALPLRLKRKRDNDLENYFMLATCYDFEKYLLLFYASTDTFYQVLYDKQRSTYRVTDNLVNDLLPAGTVEVSEHCIDANTLAVEISSEEDDYDLHFQILHIKN